MARSVPIQLPNGRHWTKKGDATLHFKSILGRYAVGARVLDPQDHEDLEALLQVYDGALTNAADRKTGIGVAYFEKRVDLEHPGRTTCFYVVRRDGTSIDFSYLRALDAAGSSK